MRILVLSDTPPSPDGNTGGGQRSFHLMRRLASEHEFTIAYVNWANQPEPITSPQNPFHLIRLPVPPGSTTPQPFFGSRNARRWREWRHALFDPMPYFLYGRRQMALQKTLSKLITEQHADVIHAIGLPMLFEISDLSGNVLADLHDVVSKMVRRQWETRGRITYAIQRWLECKKLEGIESRQLTQARAVVTVSKPDQQAIKRIAPGALVYVVPICADLDYFRPDDTAEEPATLVFTGTMNYWPNVEALPYFCSEILPRVRQLVPEVKLLIVGADPAAEIRALANDHVMITGTVPDVRPYMSRASIAVVPLKNGGGARNKIVEAWAMQRGVVSTSVGAEGLDGEDRKHWWIADDATAFANAIIDLIRQPELRRRLGENGRQLVEKQYSFAAAAQKLNDIYHSMVQ
jgi:glycosyltransferase involved in cell wall biosynthesis